ncbi:MAG: ADP-ribosylation factor-like protein [Promethearchaeota archaeon]
MSESIKKIIKYFCDRFLEIDYYPEKLSNILDLSIEKIKKFNMSIVKSLNEIDIFTIRDVSNANNKEILKLAKKKKIDPKIINSAIIGANLVSNAWNNRSSYDKKSKNKVVIAGLDFAGKTSLINRLINDHNYKDMLNLEPTVGVNIEEYETQRLNLIIWDLGGQKRHVEEYLEEPEKYFVQLDVLIFVVDAQDDIRYDLATKYLNDIMDTLEYLNEQPFLMILLNKADSDLLEDPEFQIKLEYLTEKITDLIQSKEKEWQFELIKTSLYNIYSSQPDIVKNIKNVFSFQKESESQGSQEDLNEEIQDKFQQIMDINLKLMDKFASELSGIKNSLNRLLHSKYLKSTIAIPFENIALEYYSAHKKASKKKKKKSVSIGPPQRLSEMPTPSEKGKSTKLGSEDIAKIKDELKPAPTPVFPPSNLPNIPLETPPPSTIQSKGVFLRTQVISELKDVFAKRGVTN